MLILLMFFSVSEEEQVSGGGGEEEGEGESVQLPNAPFSDDKKIPIFTYEYTSAKNSCKLFVTH
jgi:hypothetical protein